MFANYPDVLNVEDLEPMLGIGKNTAYKLVKDKKIKSVHIGRQYKIPKCCVIEYLLNDDQSQSTMWYNNRYQ